MSNELTPFEALMACREAAGSDSQMARDLDTNQPRIWRIINSAKRLPAEYVLLAERLYGVPREQLRPDLYPHGLVAGIPYDPEEPLLDVFTSVSVPPRRVHRDIRAGDADARFQGVDRRAGAQN